MSRRISPVTTKAISTDTLQEIRRIKQYLNLLASWCHHRAPNLDILICVKDHIWFTAWWHTPYNRILLLSGTNIGIILSKLDTRALPAAAPLPTPAETNPSLGNDGVTSEMGRSRNYSVEQLVVKQTKKHISTPAPHDSYLILQLAALESTGKLFSWNTCRDRYALVESALPPRMTRIWEGWFFQKGKGRAAAASASSAATVQVRLLAQVFQRSIDGHSEPVSNHHF